MVIPAVDALLPMSQGALCGAEIRLKGSHIDHIRPLSGFPELATMPENLQLTCEECNRRKGQSC